MISYKNHKLCVTRMTEDPFKTSDIILPVLSGEHSTDNYTYHINGYDQMIR